MSDTEVRPVRSSKAVDFKQQEVVQAWSRDLGITEEQLRHAVATVGNRPEKVRKFVRLNASRMRGDRPQSQ